MAGVFVTDDALVQCIRAIRGALRDEARSLVKTLPRRGYLFAGNALAMPCHGTNPGAWNGRSAAHSSSAEGDILPDRGRRADCGGAVRARNSGRGSWRGDSRNHLILPQEPPLHPGDLQFSRRGRKSCRLRPPRCGWTFFCDAAILSVVSAGVSGRVSRSQCGDEEIPGNPRLFGSSRA